MKLASAFAAGVAAGVLLDIRAGPEGSGIALALLFAAVGCAWCVKLWRAGARSDPERPVRRFVRFSSEARGLRTRSVFEDRPRAARINAAIAARNLRHDQSDATIEAKIGRAPQPSRRS